VKHTSIKLLSDPSIAEKHCQLDAAALAAPPIRPPRMHTITLRTCRVRLHLSSGTFTS